MLLKGSSSSKIEGLGLPLAFANRLNTTFSLLGDDLINHVFYSLKNIIKATIFEKIL